MGAHHASLSHHMLLFIREHPEGVTRRDIVKTFPSANIRTINGNLARLRNFDLVYNNGIMGAKGSTWFPTTPDDIPEPFFAIAEDLVAEMRSIHSEGHAIHLAKRLYELFDNPN